MIHRAPILLILSALLVSTVVGCSTGGSTKDLESTIVARVVATLESAETAPVAKQPPLEPTKTPTPSGPTVTPPPEIEAEEYAVYSAMIRQNPIGYNLGSSVLIREQTVSDLDQFERTLEHSRPLPDQLVDSYRSRNSALYTLGPGLDVELDYALLPEEEFEEIFGRGGGVWARFQESYPEARGVVTFSRVGFDATEDEALVLMGYRCGDLCGSGGLFLLTKDDGTWNVHESLMVWQS